MGSPRGCAQRQRRGRWGGGSAGDEGGRPGSAAEGSAGASVIPLITHSPLSVISPLARQAGSEGFSWSRCARSHAVVCDANRQGFPAVEPRESIREQAMHALFDILWRDVVCKELSAALRHRAAEAAEGEEAPAQHAARHRPGSHNAGRRGEAGEAGGTSLGGGGSARHQSRPAMLLRGPAAGPPAGAPVGRRGAAAASSSSGGSAARAPAAAAAAFGGLQVSGSSAGAAGRSEARREVQAAAAALARVRVGAAPPAGAASAGGGGGRGHTTGSSALGPPLRSGIASRGQQARPLASAAQPRVGSGRGGAVAPASGGARTGSVAAAETSAVTAVGLDRPHRTAAAAGLARAALVQPTGRSMSPDGRLRRTGM